MNQYQKPFIKTTDLLGLLSSISILLLLGRIGITKQWGGIFLICFWALVLGWPSFQMHLISLQTWCTSNRRPTNWYGLTLWWALVLLFLAYLWGYTHCFGCIALQKKFGAKELLTSPFRFIWFFLDTAFIWGVLDDGTVGIFLHIHFLW